MTYDFTNHKTKSLIELYSNLKATLNNQKCEAIKVPILETLSQIKSQLKNRAK